MGLVNESSSALHLVLKEGEGKRQNLSDKEGNTYTGVVGTIAGIRSVETDNGTMYCIKLYDNEPDPDGSLEEFVIWLNGRAFCDFGQRVLLSDISKLDLVKLRPFGIYDKKGKYTKWGCGLDIEKGGEFATVKITAEQTKQLALPDWEKGAKYYDSTAQEAEIFARLSADDALGKY